MDVNTSHKYNTALLREHDRTLLAIELESGTAHTIYHYQIEMIANNPSESIIPFELRVSDNKAGFYYNISKKTSLKDFLVGRQLEKVEFVNIISSIVNTLTGCRNLLLYSHNFIINEEYIFIRPEDHLLSFLYMPLEISVDADIDLKDFILKLITKSAVIKIYKDDNFLQRIIECLKMPEFNIYDFSRFLKEIDVGCRPLEDIFAAKAQDPNSAVKSPEPSFQGIRHIFGKFISKIKNRHTESNGIMKEELKPPEQIINHPIEETTLLTQNEEMGACLTSKKDDLQKIHINKDIFLIGRNPDISDLVLNEKSIGRIHSEIHTHHGNYYIIDKNSRNGTYINYEKLEGGREYKLNDNDTILFANLEYVFNLG